MTTIANDEDYAGYVLSGSKTGCMGNSPEYRSCKVVVIPHVIYRSAGSGWVFPKNSPLLPMFQHYVTAIMKEGALHKRIALQYTNDPLMKCQICPDYDGSAIGPEKVFSLFGLICTGAGLSVIIFL